MTTTDRLARAILEDFHHTGTVATSLGLVVDVQPGKISGSGVVGTSAGTQSWFPYFPSAVEAIEKHWERTPGDWSTMLFLANLKTGTYTIDYYGPLETEHLRRSNHTLDYRPVHSFVEEELSKAIL